MKGCDFAALLDEVVVGGDSGEREPLEQHQRVAGLFVEPDADPLREVGVGAETTP